MRDMTFHRATDRRGETAPPGQVRKPPELRELGELLDSCDPVPPEVLHTAYAAVRRRWSGRTRALSLVGDAVRTSSVRSGGSARVLTFRMEAHVLEMDVCETCPGWCAVRGSVLPADGADAPGGDVVLRHAAGDSAAELDEFGGFHLSWVARGPLSVVFRAGGELPAVADWLVC
ncbi:hypothetical protein GCM10027174_37460 [Salinifilum aidingensis]